MRLWSLHPQYLDTKGLLAAWREGLLAQHVLLGLTKGYRHHPQLIRFRSTSDPVQAIGSYLTEIGNEAEQRHFKFARDKIHSSSCANPIPVTEGQVAFEWQHLLKKIERRDLDRYHKVKSIQTPQCHPLFMVVAGDIEPWERV